MGDANLVELMFVEVLKRDQARAHADTLEEPERSYRKQRSDEALRLKIAEALRAARGER